MRNTRGAVPLVATVVIGLILVAGAVFLFGTPKGEEVRASIGEAIPLQVSGITIMSLDRIDMRSSYSQLDGEDVFVVTARLGGLSQNVQGLTTTTTDVNSYTDKFVKHNLEIDVQNVKQTCEYDLRIDEDKFPIAKFNYNTWYCVLSPSLAKSQEKCPTGTLVAAGKWKYSYTCACISADIVGATGEIDSLPDVNTQFDIVASAKGQEERKTFDTLTGETQGRVGSNTYAIWQGNLDTGRACEGTQGKTATYVDEKWRVTSSSAFNTYFTEVTTNNLANLKDVVGPAIWTNKEQMISELNDINAKADFALKPISFGSITNPTSLASGKVIKTLKDYSAQNPVITLFVKAEWLGIYTPIPEPKIVSTDSTCFKTGERSSIVVRIENIGNERGGFFVSADCPSPFSAKNVETTLEAGQQTTVYLDLTATTDKRVEDKCTVKVSTAGKQVTAFADVCVDPQQICTPNEKTCIDNKIMQCNEFGSGRTTIEVCDVDEKCTFEDGKPVCKAEDKCTEDKQMVCEDGTVITTHKCIAGKLISTGKTCEGEVPPPTDSLEACYIGIEAQYTGLAKLSVSNQLSMVWGKIKCWFAFKSGLIVAGLFAGIILAVGVAFKGLLRFLPPQFSSIILVSIVVGVFLITLITGSIWFGVAMLMLGVLLFLIPF